MKNAKFFFKTQDNTTVEILAENDARSDRTSNESKAAENVTMEMFVSGAEIVVVCDTGYELDGDEVRTCTEEESWSSTFVSCVPRNCSIGDHPVFKLLEKLENETVFVNDTITSSKFYQERYGTGVYKSFEIFVEGNSYGQEVILSCQNSMQMNLDKLLLNETIFNITWRCNDATKWENTNLSLEESSLELLLNDSMYICDRSCASPQVRRIYFNFVFFFFFLLTLYF